MGNVVRLRPAEPLVYVCGFPGCQNKTFMLFDDGRVECGACGAPQNNGVLHLYPRRKDYSTVVTTYPQENGMAKIDIVAPRRYAVHVVVYEPRQSPEQAEVVLDTFDLEAGEVRKDYELRSATAAYRVERIEDHATIRANETEEAFRRADNPFAGISDPQEPGPDGISVDAQAEIDAGKEAHDRNQKREKARERLINDPDAERETRATSRKTSKTAAREKVLRPAATEPTATEKAAAAPESTADALQGGNTVTKDAGKPATDAGQPKDAEKK